MGNVMDPCWLKFAIWFLEKCGFVVKDRYSLKCPLYLIVLDILLSMTYCFGNLWALWVKGMGSLSVFLNMLCLIHATIMTGISRSKYFQGLGARNCPEEGAPNAYLRIILPEFFFIGGNVIICFYRGANLVKSIILTLSIIIVFLDTIRSDLESIFDVSPT